MTDVHKTAIVSNCEIGSGVFIGAGCLIGEPAENRDTWPETLFGVEVHDGAILCGLVTVDSGTVRNTVIGQRVMMMKGSHAGHDAIIGDDVTIACGAKIGGHCEVGKGSNLGLNCVLHPRVKIAPFAMIGAGAVVTKTADVKPFGIWAGNPAKFLKFNQRAVEKFGLTPEQVTQIQNDWLNERQETGKTH